MAWQRSIHIIIVRAVFWVFAIELVYIVTAHAVGDNAAPLQDWDSECQVGGNEESFADEARCCELNVVCIPVWWFDGFRVSNKLAWVALKVSPLTLSFTDTWLRNATAMIYWWRPASHWLLANLIVPAWCAIHHTLHDSASHCLTVDTLQSCKIDMFGAIQDAMCCTAVLCAACAPLPCRRKKKYSNEITWYVEGDVTGEFESLYIVHSHTLALHHPLCIWLCLLSVLR